MLAGIEEVNPNQSILGAGIGGSVVGGVRPISSMPMMGTLGLRGR
jgi:hypothetical protein